MKQRLLLSLLMLFVSVGLVKAADGNAFTNIEIVIPSGDKTVTMSLTSDKFTFNKDNYPNLKKGSDVVQPKSYGKTVIWELKQDAKDSQTFSLLTATNSSDWGKISIVLDGAVSEFTILEDKPTDVDEDSKKFLGEIESLTFKNNGGNLSALKLGNSSTNTSYLSGLTELVVPDNKLTYIPAKTDKITKYSIGKVEWKGEEYSGYGANNTAKSYLLYPEELFEHTKGIYNNLKSIQQNELQIIALKDAEGNDITSYATGQGNWDKAKAFYHFRNANGVYDKYGVFTADIKILNEAYKDVVLTGVKLNVKQATFKLAIDNPDDNKVTVKVTVNGEDFDVKTGTLTYGQQFALSAVSQEGYQFAGFEVVKGATAGEQQGDSHFFTVDGDDDIEIKVKSEASSNKIVFEQDPAGTLEVLSDNGRLTSGSAITTGEELSINVEAKEGFEIAKVEINGTEVKGELTNEKRIFKGTAKVPAVAKGEDVVIKVTYTAKKYTFEVVRDGVTADGLKSFKVYEKADDKRTDLAEGSENEYSLSAGTQLEIVIEMQNANSNVSAQINGEAQKFRKDGESVYIIDYTMPNRDSKLVLTIDALKQITVTLDENVLPYNGQPQSITSDMYQVKVTDADGNEKVVNMTGFKPLTYASSDKATEWTTKAYDAIGTYYVRFQRDADAQYQAVDEKRMYKIAGVQLVITELPTVKVVEKDGKDTYEITGGKVGYQQGDKMYSLSADEMAKAGKFELVFEADESFVATAKSVSVQFTANTDNKNMLTSEAATVALVDKEGKSATIEVEVNKASAPGLIIMNGGAEVHNSDKLADGTKLTFDVKDAAPADWDKVVYEVYRVEKEGNTIKKEEVWPSDTKGYEIDLDGKDGNGRELLSFLLEVKDSRTQAVLNTNTSQTTQEVIYNGKAQEFFIGHDSLKWNNSKGGEIAEEIGIYTADNYWTITYTQNGTIVPEPVNVGTYDVTLVREDSKNYKAMEATGKLVILPKKLTEEEIGDVTPKASAIGAGSPLSDSELTGTPNIAGKYVWAESDGSVDKTGNYRVKFVPADPNYAEVELTKTVKVEVTDEYILTYSNPDGLGMIEVRDAYGIVPSGSTLKKDTKLYLTAKPKDATKVRLIDITGVDDISYTDAGVTNAPFTFNGKMDIRAYFEVIEQEVIDPDSRYIVSVTASGRGFVVETGEFGVPRGGSYNFAVEALAEDMSKIVVKTSRGETLKPKDGFYSVEEVDENISVSVSLPNPTELEVEIPEEYKNKGGYVVGTVRVESDYLDDKYYYGDVITVIAFPESGVKFDKWSDGSKAQMHEITLYKDTKLEASFTGTPTGIEDIETAKVYTGKGFIQINNVANAEVTVVSISGRLQAKQEISGDMQIAVPQGIYVVVLQSGDDMKQLKVIVK